MADSFSEIRPLHQPQVNRRACGRGKIQGPQSTNPSSFPVFSGWQLDVRGLANVDSYEVGKSDTLRGIDPDSNQGMPPAPRLCSTGKPSLGRSCAPLQRQKQPWFLRLEIMHHRGCNTVLTLVILYSTYRILWEKSHFRTEQNNKHWAS